MAAKNYHDNIYDENKASNCTNLQDLIEEMTISDGNSHIIPASQIKIERRLGSGEFGIVQQAIWTTGVNKIKVAVKCITQCNIQSNPTEFIKEARIMHSIKHENIVTLFGIVLDADTQMLVTELAPMRSLLECLKDLNLRNDVLNVLKLCEFSLQICKGMAYLENKRLIHRDLAARNILVFDTNLVKISDFGLSRALSIGKTYYQTHFTPNLRLPIAWCAPESINFLRFTTSSDVFSFGVCLWELFSYGMQPWQSMTGQQILEAIDEPNFRRLEKPDYCPEGYYALMMKCWLHDPFKRPKFCEMVDVLPQISPIQVKAISFSCESKENDMLKFVPNDTIIVLDSTSTPFWKGVLSNGKVGFFEPSKTDFNFGNAKKNQKSFKKKSIFSKVLSNPSHALKLDSTQNDIAKHIVEDQEHLLPLTPTTPDFSSSFENMGSKSISNVHFKFFEPNCSRQIENCSHKDSDDFVSCINNLCNDNNQTSSVLSKEEFLRKEVSRIELPTNVKRISSKDQKILDHAIEIAYKCSTRSMKSPMDSQTTYFKRKPKKKYPNLNTDECGFLKSHENLNSNPLVKEGRYFTEAIKEKVEISFTDESKEAYENLVQNGKKELSAHEYPSNSKFNGENFTFTRSKKDKLLNTENVHDLVHSTQSQTVNVFPLPPKPILGNCHIKKHVRKHPLIINKIESVVNDNNQKIEYKNLENQFVNSNDTSLIKF